METISAAEFRVHQGKYLDMIKRGIDIIIKSRNRGSFKITPIEEDDDSLMTKEEFFAKIDEGIRQIENGEYYELLPGEDLEDFLERVKKEEQLAK